MIYDLNFKYTISNLGWVDKGHLWIYNSEKKDSVNFKLSDSQYLSIYQGQNDYFSIGHNYNDSKFEITIHHFSNPTIILCKLSFDNFKTSVNGDVSLLRQVPKYYLASLKLNDDFKFHLFNVENGQMELFDNKLDWYYDGNFDFGYQGLIGVTEYKSELIFCVQRDGSLYRYSLESNKIIEKISLAKQYGNPRVTFCEDFKELWVDDYDTLLKINPQNWKIEKSKQLQPAQERTGQFIGSYSINKDSIIVPRPFSSDILLLDKNLNIKTKINVGKQPLEAVILKNLIVARDWQTGALITKEVNNLDTMNKLKLKEKLIKWVKRN